MLDPGQLDLDEIVLARGDREYYEHRWLIDPSTGEIVFWTSDTGIDGQDRIDLDELDHLVSIEQEPSYVRYREMAVFAEGISDRRAGERLGRAIEGKGAFRRFKDALHQQYPELLPAWHAFSDSRGRRRAVDWLAERRLIEESAAELFLDEHPNPDLP
ncbi:MAG: UPF0158 family protein [Actinomycetota bacterium]|nr:UPF0158 family protein [Actinomycetota bacterium]